MLLSELTPAKRMKYMADCYLSNGFTPAEAADRALFMENYDQQLEEELKAKSKVVDTVRNYQ